jgi:hypothetical protein
MGYGCTMCNVSNNLFYRKEMIKEQEFKNEVGTFSYVSTYHPEDRVWTSSFDGMHNEWDSEKEMRLDMLIYYASENEKEYWTFKLWDCRNEDDFLEMYNDYQTNSEQCHEYND